MSERRVWSLHALEPSARSFKSQVPVRSFSGEAPPKPEPTPTAAPEPAPARMSVRAFEADVRLSLALNDSAHRGDERRKVLHAAGFLQGAGRRWYLDLLRANLAAHCPAAEHTPTPTAIGTATVDEERGRGERPAYWATFSFVIEPLASLDNFFRALREAFPAWIDEGEGDPAGPTAKPAAPAPCPSPAGAAHTHQTPPEERDPLADRTNGLGSHKQVHYYGAQL